MEEKIYILPSTTKLALTLAYHNKNVFNTRFFTPVELAKEALLRSGKICKLKFISRNEELIYYKKIIETNSYFKTSKLADIRSVNQAINTIRLLSIKDESVNLKTNLSKGIFKEKNDALFNIYDKYNKQLNKDNMIDSIGLIRYVVENIEISDINLITLKEYPLKPLEKELLNKVTSNLKEESIFDLFDVKDKDIKIDSFNSAYGTSNEVASIIDDIFSNRKMDQCVVACAEYNSYSQVFYDYACKHDISLTFDNGISLINSYPGKLLKQYYYWSNIGNYGFEPFLKLIYSPYFNFELLDSLVEIEKETSDDRIVFWNKISKLRLTNDTNVNKQRINDFKDSISRKDITDNGLLEKYIKGFEVVANELSLPIEEFLNKYYISRKNNEFVVKFDESAIKTIINELKTIKRMGLPISDDIIETLLKKKTYRQSNKPGHIHITSIENAIFSLRNNLYICGLSSSLYPGSPRENPLLLDSDLKDFNNEELSSQGKILRKRDNLLCLVKLASLLGNYISLSYPGLNVAELKNNNASSLMFELYKTCEKKDVSLQEFKKSINHIDYFKPNLSNTKKIGEAYNDKKEIVYKALNTNNKNDINIKLKSYSPSALNTFFNCKKQFFYQYVIGISQPDKYNPYEVIASNEQGTLVHALMEYLPDHNMTLEEFKKLAEDVFNEYMKISVPLIMDKIDDIKEQFVEMLENGYNMDKNNPREIVLKEEDNEAIHDQTGIKVHGFPDRVEKTKDNKAVIIDFKTKKRFDEYKKDDIDTCLQVLIYAYIVEKVTGMQIDHCEYRMLRFENGIITCKYDDEMKEKLNIKLQEFSDSITNGNYEIEPMSKDEEKEKCKYCMFGTICGKVIKEDD